MSLTRCFRFQAARRSLDAKEVELGKLRLKIEDSTGTHAAYKALQKCGESTVGEYSYKICPFEDAKQGHVPCQKVRLCFDA